MKISVLTPSFNQGAFLEKNIQSVLSQNYSDFEHIIIDGGSTDNTVEILKKYPHLKWVSEPDDGQADALNKGLSLANGDLIGWVNSDDYYEENVFDNVASHFEDSSVKWIIGNITYFYTGLDIEKPVTSTPITYDSLLRNPDIVKQQGVFFRRKTLDEVGGWAKDFFMVMDYDLWVKISKKCSPKMINKNYAYFLVHEGQKSSYKNLICQTKEINAILKQNQVSLILRLPIAFKKYKYAVKGVLKSFLISMGIIDKKFENIPLSAVKNDK